VELALGGIPLASTRRAIGHEAEEIPPVVSNGLFRGGLKPAADWRGLPTGLANRVP